MLARDFDRDIRLYTDAAGDSRLLALVRDALPLSKSPQYSLSHRLLVDDGSSSSADAEARQLLRGVGVDIASVAGRSDALLWACAADGVAGVLETDRTQSCSRARRPTGRGCGRRPDSWRGDSHQCRRQHRGPPGSSSSSSSSGGAILEVREGAGRSLRAGGARGRRLNGFLGADAAEIELWAAGLGGEVGDAHTFGEGKPGAGRGDTACLPDTLLTALLARLDELVAAIGKKAPKRISTTTQQLRAASTAARVAAPHHGQVSWGNGQLNRFLVWSCRARALRQCRFRSWPMLATYKPGNRYTYHLDNPRGRNGRVLTVIFYLNRGWTSDDGGVLRLLRPAKGCSRSSSARSRGDGGAVQVMAEAVPTLDTSPCSGRTGVPHEVPLPSGKFSGGSDRRAVSVWYLCPSRGPSSSQKAHRSLEWPGDGSSGLLAAADMAAKPAAGRVWPPGTRVAEASLRQPRGLDAPQAVGCGTHLALTWTWAFFVLPRADCVCQLAQPPKTHLNGFLGCQRRACDSSDGDTCPQRYSPAYTATPRAQPRHLSQRKSHLPWPVSTGI